ncbi:MAG: hypothetical protein WCG01_01400 [bacterium]
MIQTTELFVDREERGQRYAYIILELFVLVFWPLLVFTALLNLFEPWLSIPVSLVVLFWPIIKRRYADIIAKENGIKDPRHAIRCSSFWFDGFMFQGSPVLRQIRQNAALSKSLDVIYNYFGRFNIAPEGYSENWWNESGPSQLVNTLIKKWTDFWCCMPIAQDVRSRLLLVQKEIETSVLDIYLNTGKEEISIVLLAGGTKQDVIMASRTLLNKIPNLKLKVVCVEPDGKFAVSRSKKLAQLLNLDTSIFVDIFKQICVDEGKEQLLCDVLAEKKYVFSDFDLVICIGLGDYMFGNNLNKFMKMIDNGKKIITANISDNYVERFFLHLLIHWPAMQYLSLAQYKAALLRNYPNRTIRITQTPHRIFNVAVIESR